MARGVRGGAREHSDDAGRRHGGGKQNDANTAEALKAAQGAVSALAVLKGYGIFRTSPAGKSTDAWTPWRRPGQHGDRLVDLADEVVDDHRVDTLGDTGIQPGDETYVAPVAADPTSATPGTEPGTPPRTGPGADPDETGTVS